MGQLASLRFAVCPAGDLAKGPEAAASGEGVSKPETRASTSALEELHFHAGERTQCSGAARETPTCVDPETENQKQPSASASNKHLDREKCGPVNSDQQPVLRGRRQGMQWGPLALYVSAGSVPKIHVKKTDNPSLTIMHFQK